MVVKKGRIFGVFFGQLPTAITQELFVRIHFCLLYQQLMITVIITMITLITVMITVMISMMITMIIMIITIMLTMITVIITMKLEP